MAQIFSHHANTIARASILGFALVVAFGWWIEP
jgi:hypothetical protein